MTGRVVADASVAIAWVHPAQATRETDEILDELARETRLVVPALWLLEVANALLVLQRCRKIGPDERLEALESLQALRPSIDDQGSRLAFGRVSEIAAAHRLSVYDAVYVELALREGAPLATKDTSLRAAARRAGARTR